MIEILDNAILVAGALTVLISGLVEVIKQATDLQAKYVPLLSVGIGLAVGVVLAFGFNLSVPDTILAGLIGGLSASGFYDNLKA